MKAKYEAAVVDIAGAATWIGNTHRLWYRKLSRGMNVYTILDADSLEKRTAFDHDMIAADRTQHRWIRGELLQRALVDRFMQSPATCSTSSNQSCLT